MTPPTTEIGDKWAANISRAFQDWAANEENKGRANTKIMRFDPTPLIEGAFFESAEAQLVELGKMLGGGIKFDLRSPEAEAWIKAYGAQEIKYLEASQRKAIQQITLRAFEEGLTVQEQSKLIREHIGLLPNHIKAVENYRSGLKDIDPALADRLEEKYRKKLLKWRADTIALTEGHTAANEGNREATRGAVKRGILSPEEYERYWMVTRDKRICSICSGLSGIRADLPDGNFEGDGRGPPLHQRCRCCEGIRRK